MQLVSANMWNELVSLEMEIIDIREFGGLLGGQQIELYWDKQGEAAGQQGKKP